MADGIKADDPLTELQRHLQQRDAPQNGTTPEFINLQHQLATDLSTSIRSFNNLLEDKIPEYFKGYMPDEGWPGPEEIRKGLEERMERAKSEVLAKRERGKFAEMEEWFNNLVFIYLSPKSTKLWRATADPLLLKLCPSDFDASMLGRGSPNFLELMLALKPASSSCKQAIKEVVTMFLSDCSADTEKIFKDISFTTLCIKQLGDMDIDFEGISLDALFTICSKLIDYSSLFTPQAAHVWNRFADDIFIADWIQRSETEGALTLLALTEKENLKWPQTIPENIWNISFHLQKHEVLLESFKYSTDRNEGNFCSAFDVWIYLLQLRASALSTETIESEEAAKLVGTLLFYLGCRKNLCNGMEGLEAELKGKFLETIVIQCIDIMAITGKGREIEEILMKDQSWHWVANRRTICWMLVELCTLLGMSKLGIILEKLLPAAVVVQEKKMPPTHVSDDEWELRSRYQDLMDMLTHDHDHVVGYASCCAECYCD